MDKDLFVRRMREEPDLRKSFQAFVAEMRDKLKEEMVSLNAVDMIRMAQGSIRGLDRLQTRLQKDIGPSIDTKSKDMPNG